MLGVHSAADAILDATLSHSHLNANVLSEVLRFCATLEKEELWELFYSDDKRLTGLWDLRKANITPASLFTLLVVCTTLAENEEARERLAQTISLESLKEITESYPFAADHVAVLRTYLGK